MHADQWVVARRPASSPAAARTNAPLHTDATRRLRSAATATHDVSSRSRAASAVPSPPATTSVSIGPRQPAARAVASPSPDDVTTSPPSCDTTVGA